MKKLLKAAILREREFISGIEKSDQKDNPQVVTMRLQAEGRLQVFEAVLFALRGDQVDLKIFAGKL